MPIITFNSRNRDAECPDTNEIPKHEDLFDMEMPNYTEDQEGYKKIYGGFSASFFGQDFYGQLAIVGQGYKNRIILLDPTRKIYYVMLPSDFTAAARDGFVNGGIVSGMFRFKKAGSAPGITMVR